MKFLVDECVGPTVASWLNGQGYDVVSIYDELQGIDDDLVLEKAFLENRILNYGQDLLGNFVVATEKNVRIIKLSFI